MSARRFPRDVPRCVQHAVLAALDLVDETGEVVGGMAALQIALNHDCASSTRRAVSQAEQWGYLRRTGPIGHPDGHEQRGLVVVSVAREARRGSRISARSEADVEPERRIDA